MYQNIFDTFWWCIKNVKSNSIILMSSNRACKYTESLQVLKNYIKYIKYIRIWKKTETKVYWALNKNTYQQLCRTTNDWKYQKTIRTKINIKTKELKILILECKKNKASKIVKKKKKNVKLRLIKRLSMTIKRSKPIINIFLRINNHFSKKKMKIKIKIKRLQLMSCQHKKRPVLKRWAKADSKKMRINMIHLIYLLIKKKTFLKWYFGS